jgi:uncharacterized membrane protein/protein-disulfide isomerase
MAHEDRTPLAEWLLRGFAALGLGTSVLLLIEYLRPAPTFCDDAAGCGVVRASVYAQPLGIPTPLFGVLFFATTLALALVPRAWGRRFLVYTAAAGAVGSIGFLVIQAFVLHAWCKYCVIADGSALALLALAIPLRGRIPPALRPSGWLAFGGTAAIAFAAPFGVAMALHRGPDPVVVPLPAVVAAEQKPGVATIVEFLDFQCPYCRKLHHSLAPILAGYGARVRVVRKMVPLPAHVHAEEAARAWCCAADAGKGDEMADALMSSDDLTTAGCEKLAVSLGLDVDTYRACLQDSRTAERVSADFEAFRAAGLRALPSFWIGDERFVGVPEADAIRGSIDRALVKAGKPTPGRAG